MMSTLASLLPERASTNAASVDHLFVALLAFAGGLLVLVFGLMVGFGVRYRRGTKVSRSMGPRSTLKMELSWIAAMTLLGFGLFLWAAKVYFDVERPPASAVPIYVVGKQWMWKVSHPGGREEINELHVPVGEPVKLVMTSQDVIHSFYVPAFRQKQDVLPNRYTTLWFQADRTGRFPFYCAEYCGTDHSAMRGAVVVMEPHQYQRWLSAGSPGEAPVPGTPGTPGAPLVTRGKGPFFHYGCNSCHTRDSAVRAPRLDGLFGREVRLHNGSSVIADEDYIRESIVDPNAKIVAGYPAPSLMPTYKGQITDAELRELIELLRSIREGWPAEERP